jgi:hypothetical protein
MERFLGELHGMALWAVDQTQRKTDLGMNPVDSASTPNGKGYVDAAY